jgi:hypothetical protein
MLLLSHLLAENGAGTFETWVKSGTVRGATVAITGTPLVGEHNDVMGGVAVLRDVTGQCELEAKLCYLRSASYLRGARIGNRSASDGRSHARVHGARACS